MIAIIGNQSLAYQVRHLLAPATKRRTRLPERWLQCYKWRTACCVASEEMNRDRYGLPLTTESARAAEHYREGIDCILSAWYGPCL
jgi:hypothetical protein